MDTEIFAKPSRHPGLIVTVTERKGVRPRFAAYLRKPDRQAPLLVTYAAVAGDAITRVDNLWVPLGGRVGHINFESFYSSHQA